MRGRVCAVRVGEGAEGVGSGEAGDGIRHHRRELTEREHVRAVEECRETGDVLVEARRLDADLAGDRRHRHRRRAVAVGEACGGVDDGGSGEVRAGHTR